MNFLDFATQKPEFWRGTAAILDAVLTNGIDETFTRAEREMIFAKCSELNGCVFCAEHHSKLAVDLGFNDTLSKDDYLFIEKVMNNTYKFVNYDIDKLNNIRYIAGVVKMVNHYVKEFDITQVDNNNTSLKDTPIKIMGYNLI